MTNLNDCYLRPTNQDQQKLYDHLLYCVQTESPSTLIERIRTLFIEGTAYSEVEIKQTLEEIIISKQADEQFKFVLNRCCHILINRWQVHPQLQPAIPQLVALFDNLRSPGTVQFRKTRRLRQLVQNFTKTEQYLTLKRLARVVEEEKVDELVPGESSSQQIANLIKRYPYLYEHCLLSEDSDYEHQQAIRQIQAQRQHRFEIDLSKFVTYQVRLAQSTRSRKSLARPGKSLQPVENPTLLSDRELGLALKCFVGNVEGNYGYRDLAQNFLHHIHDASSYEVFKEDLYEYLISSVDSKYCKRQFSDKLYKHLKNTLSRYDSEKPSELLILRTSSQLLNFLVVESRHRPNHYVFVDLITNLGATNTVCLLLKIVLICNKVKPYLEKRFSILFNHYEFSTNQGVPWLVKSLENVHVAFSVHFGAVDLSYLKQIM